MHSTRRSILLMLGTGITGGLAGCSRSAGDQATPPVTITIENRTPKKRTIKLLVVPTSIESNRAEELLVQQLVTLAPMESDGSSKRLLDAFDAQKALVQVKLPSTGVIDQYTYIPDCTSDENVPSKIYISLESTDSAVFDQNYCHS